ncbi:hypothetical protein [Neobacillus sp. FSL H8-0543]|uniref:hypothetical protein n=1 Tax=Neobacillus sp. FSL H8-0543 TaxID=2954672 RepID=UPI003158A0F4
MLTPAQKKVRQEMEELQINGQLRHSVAKVPPVMRHTEPKKRVKRGFFGPLLILSLIILVIYQFYTKESTEKAISYLSELQTINGQSDQMFNQDPRKINLNTLAIQQAIESHEDLLLKVKDLQTPSNFKNHKRDFINMLEQRGIILSYLATASTDTSTLNKYLLELKIKQELQRDSLALALENAKIEYEQVRDGTISYWFNDKAFQYK